MNVHDTIKRGLLSYPSLYSTPGDVLHQLFAVNGNGFEWVNGELVYIGRTERDDGTEWINQQIVNARERGHSDSLVLHYEKMLHEFKFTKQYIDRVIKHGEHRYKSQMYPLCQYAGIMTVPDDVKDDWLKAAYQFCEDCMVTIRSRMQWTSEDDKHLILLKDLRDKFDNLLIGRGLHSTLAERATLIDRVSKELEP